jgi:hypothetical protein
MPEYKTNKIIRKLGKSKYLSLRNFEEGDVLEIRKIEELEVNESTN